MLPGTEDNKINFSFLLTYVAIALKHVRLMLLLVCMSLAAGLVYYIYSRPVYYCRAMIEVDYTPLPIDTQKGFGDSGYAEVLSQFQSATVVEMAAKKLGIDAGYAEIMDEYMKRIQVLATSNGDLVIMVWPYDKDLAGQWPKALFESFIENRDRSRNEYKRSKLATYLKEIARADAANADFEKRLARFRDGQQMMQAKLEVQNLETVPDELVGVNRIIEKFESIRELLANDAKTNIEKFSLLAKLEDELELEVGDTVYRAKPDSMKDHVVMTDGGKETTQVVQQPPVIMQPRDLRSATAKEWEDLEARAQDVKTRYDALSAKYLPGHPAMASIQKEYADVQAEMENKLRDTTQRYEWEYQNILNRRQDLQQKIVPLEAAKQRLTALENEEQAIKATQLSWRTIKLDLLKELATLDYSVGQERMQLHYMGTLYVSPNPVSPHRAKLMAFSLIFGLFLALVVPFGLEFLDNTVSEPSIIENRLGVQPLGIIPRYHDEMTPADLAKANAIGTAGMGEMDLGGIRLETFRVLRANFLANRSISQARQVIMVTSSLPREGKSMTSMNLAMSFAQAGEKTLLIDADVRRGRQHRRFNQSAKPGLSDALQIGDTDALSYCRSTPVENLDIIPCGTRTSRFPELVTDELLTPFINTLRDKYKRIVIDTTPVLGLAETHSLLPYVDGVLLVVWGGYTPQRAVEDAVNQLVLNGAVFYGFLLNQVDLSVATNYQRYYYYSTYYYSSYRDPEGDHTGDPVPPKDPKQVAT